MTRKAIVLAAGIGTRLKPFTRTVPKPLMPIWGEPMLERMVGMLREWGVTDIVVNCHHLHEQVEAWAAEVQAMARDGADGEFGIRANYEPEILGTGGVLNPLRDWIGGENFYLVNGDIVLDGATASDLDLPRGGIAGADVIGTCLVSHEGPRTVEVEPTASLITCYRSPDAGYRDNVTYCGVAHLTPAILNYVEPKGFSSLIQAYERAMQDGRFIIARSPEGLQWSDAGTVESYMALNADGGENAYGELPQVKPFADGKPVTFLGARGSDRAFFRMHDDRIVIVYDDAVRAENARYSGHARWLKAQGIPVPEVLANDPKSKTLVLAWAGSERKMSLEDYVHVVEGLAKFNMLDCSGLSLEPPFGDGLWKWERELFAEHCLGTRYHRTMSDDVRGELERVAEMLEAEPKQLVHRDFQSTNILWKNGAFSFIDFQGMRMGPAVYDLASLLYDPYVTPFSEGERRALVKLYSKRCGRDVSKVVPFAAVERLVQCLGAYGRLASVGQPQFGRHVLPALQNLLTAADEAGLDAVGALAEDLIAHEASSHEAHHHRHHHGHEGCECHCHESR